MEIGDINLDEIKEKPLLPADREMTLAIIKAEVRIGKQPNAKTGQKEPYINCEMTPLDPEWAGQDYKVYHTFGLTMGALQSPDPTFSVKKFYQVLKFVPESNKIRTEDLQTLQFVGKLKYDDKRPTLPQLAAVMRPVD
jgi:hypothetical protein